LEASCAHSEDDDSSPQQFVTEDAGTLPHGLCVEEQCPLPVVTCAGSGGLCTTNLNNDVNNCGACGAKCPAKTHATNGSWVCSDGVCKLACAALLADCNNSTADTCAT